MIVIVILILEFYEVFFLDCILCLDLNEVVIYSNLDCSDSSITFWKGCVVYVVVIVIVGVIII